MKILNKFLKKHIWKILNLTKEKDTEKAKEQATSNELKFFRAEERKQRLQKAGSRGSRGSGEGKGKAVVVGKAPGQAERKS